MYVIRLMWHRNGQGPETTEKLKRYGTREQFEKWWEKHKEQWCAAHFPHAMMRGFRVTEEGEELICEHRSQW